MSARPTADRILAARHALRVASSYLPKEVQVEIDVLLSATDSEDDCAKRLRETIVHTLHRWQCGEGDGDVYVGYELGKAATKDALRDQNRDLRATLDAIHRGDLEVVRAAESYFGEDYE